MGQKGQNNAKNGRTKPHASHVLGAGASHVLGAGASHVLGAGASHVLGAGASHVLGAGASHALGAGPRPLPPLRYEIPFRVGFALLRDLQIEKHYLERGV
jgi:hypothetical protein